MARFDGMMLWTDDFLADTTGLDRAEIGSYLLLLLAAWRSRTGALPDDDKMLARMARCSAHEWKRVRPVMLRFFEIHNQQWTQDRLSRELKETEKRSISAKGSARRGWEKRKNANAPDEAKPLEDIKTDDANAVPSQSDRNATGLGLGLGSTDIPPNPPKGGNVVDLLGRKVEPPPSKRQTLEQLVQHYRADFDAFYAAYPRKKKPDTAARAYAKARHSGVTHDEIMLGLRRAQWNSDPTQVPYPASWLNGGCWKDVPDAEPETQLRTRL